MGEHTRHTPSLRSIGVALAAVVLLGAMAADTTFLGPDAASEVGDVAFDPVAYADETFPQIVQMVAEDAVALPELAAAIATDASAAGEQHGTDLGGRYGYQVRVTGTVDSVDADFIELSVADMPEGSTVRIPLGQALSGTPVRDVTGTIEFGDFVDQTAYQSVANEFKLRMRSQVLEPADPPSLPGKDVTVLGAYIPGGPEGAYLIQPVSIEVVS